MIKQIEEQPMNDTQTLNAILEAYTNWKEMRAAMPNSSDKPYILDGYEKEIANLEHNFFTLMDEAVERAWRNATFDEDDEIPMEEFLK